MRPEAPTRPPTPRGCDAPNLPRPGASGDETPSRLRPGAPEGEAPLPVPRGPRPRPSAPRVRRAGGAAGRVRPSPAALPTPRALALRALSSPRTGQRRRRHGSQRGARPGRPGFGQQGRGRPAAVGRALRPRLRQREGAFTFSGPLKRGLANFSLNLMNIYEGSMLFKTDLHPWRVKGVQGRGLGQKDACEVVANNETVPEFFITSKLVGQTNELCARRQRTFT